MSKKVELRQSLLQHTENMPKKKPFIDRKEAKHYQLLFRSRRDPLIHDNDASDRVLQEVVPGNFRGKIQTRQELEQELGPEQTKLRDNTGEATLYGIYFDDTEYDYMQHLRPVGASDAVLLENPALKKDKGKQREDNNVQFKDDPIALPDEVFASRSEMSLTYQNQQNIPEELKGFQPDMDPKLREVLEALEDEEYVDNDVDDDFFLELSKEGNGDADEDEEADIDGDLDDEEDWRARFSAFKKHEGESEDEFDDEEEGTRASAFSMSSSAMFRNKNLTLLDQRFDKIEEEYEESEDENDEEGSAGEGEEDEEERAALEAAMDEFMDKYEVLGSKLKEKLVIGGDSADKLSAIRDGVKVEKGDKKTMRMQKLEDEIDKEDDEDDIDLMIEEPEIKWDCETILSTYSRFDNHPLMIREQNTPRIKINRKTGMPEVQNGHRRKPIEPAEEASDSEESDHEDKPDTSIGRSKLESKEEKKARKQAVKEERKNRRSEKKATKAAFATERTKQKRQLKGSTANTIAL